VFACGREYTMLSGGFSCVAGNGLSDGVAISSASIDHSCGRTGLVHPPGPSTEAATFDAQGLP
jgi:hypothetical protein